MTSISQQITDHLKQCHETFDSERLLELARDEIDRLNHEMEATKESARAREALLREAQAPFVDFFDKAMGGFTEGYAERNAKEGNECWGWNGARLYFQQFLDLRAALNSEAN